MYDLKKAGKLPEHQMGFFKMPRAEEELYDCQNDPYELKNLAKLPEYAAILKELRDELTKWQKETNDLIPKKRTLDEFDRFTGEATDARVRPRKSKAEMIKAGMIEKR